MITNIVDDRFNDKQWSSVWGTVEPTFHDNSCKWADKAVVDSKRVGFVEFSSSAMTFAELLKWAETFPGENTLYVSNDEPKG